MNENVREKLHKLNPRFHRLLYFVIVMAVAIVGIAVFSLVTTAKAVDLEDCRVTLAEAEPAFTGKAIDPGVTIRCGKKTLKEGENYELEFADNTQPGKADITIAGKNGFTGVIHVPFTIHVDPAHKLKAKYVKAKKNKEAHIDLTWDPSSCCSYYQVEVIQEGDGGQTSTYQTKDNAYQVLSPNKFGSYSFTVTAVGGKKKVASTAEEASIEMNSLEKPTVEAEGAGCRRIAVSWNNIPDAQSYTIVETRKTTGAKETYTVTPAESKDSKGEKDNRVYLEDKPIGATYSYTVQAAATVDGIKYTGPVSKASEADAPAPKIGEAAMGETGSGSGNKLGDQTGHEVEIDKWRGGWTHVIRFKDREKANKAADLMEAGCLNDCVGYDNGSKSTRLSFFYEAQANGWDASKISNNCATACSQMVAACVNASGIGAKPDVDANMLYDNLRSFDDFEVLTGSEYTSSGEGVQRGDILVRVHTNSNHAAMVL